MNHEAENREIVRRVVRYTLTPQIWPRLQGLFFSGFSQVAFFMAQIYRGVRLLPADHSYLNPANMGRYGIRHVIAEAGNNLVVCRQNIDQFLVYILMLIGMALLILQTCMLLLSFSVQSARAWTFNPGNIGTLNNQITGRDSSVGRARD